MSSEAHIAAVLKPSGIARLIVDGTDITRHVNAVVIRAEHGKVTSVLMELPADVRLNAESTIERPVVDPEGNKKAIDRFLESVDPEKLEQDVAKIADFGSRPGPDYLSILKRMADER